MYWKESKVIDQVMGVSYWTGIPTFEICLVWGVAQMAKDNCLHTKEAQASSWRWLPPHLAWRRHPPSYESRILRNVCVYVLAYDLHRFEIVMILLNLPNSTRVLESILWSKNQGTQINNPGKNGDEPKPRINDESPGVLAYHLHRCEVEMILYQTPQIH